MSAQYIAGEGESPLLEDANRGSHWGNCIADILPVCDMTPRNHGPTTLAMSAGGTQPACAMSKLSPKWTATPTLTWSNQCVACFHPRE